VGAVLLWHALAHNMAPPPELAARLTQTGDLQGRRSRQPARGTRQLPRAVAATRHRGHAPTRTASAPSSRALSLATSQPKENPSG
jgi:hypothetical protein